MFLTFWNATVEWSNKTVSTVRGVSNNFLRATLSDTFSVSTSIFFFYVLFGFTISVRRKYKDYIIPYMVGSNFSVFKQVEQKLNWETFFNVTWKQIDSLVSLPSTKEALLSLGETKADPQERAAFFNDEGVSSCLASPKVTSRHQPFSRGEFQPLLPDSSFLKRVDVYPDLILLKLNERWRNIVDQNYLGFFPALPEENVSLEKKVEDGFLVQQERGTRKKGSGTPPFFNLAENPADSFRFFARKRIDFPSDRRGRRVDLSTSSKLSFYSSPKMSLRALINSDREAIEAILEGRMAKEWKGRPFSFSKSYPLFGSERQQTYQDKRWFHTFSMPLDEIPFKLESETILYDVLQSSGERKDPFFLLDEKEKIEWETKWSRLKQNYQEETLQEVLDDFDVDRWEEVSSNNSIEVRSMSGHRCPDTGKREVKALFLHRWSQHLLSRVARKLFYPSQGIASRSASAKRASFGRRGQDFIQTIQISLPFTFNISLPYTSSPSDPSLPWVEIKYCKLELAGLKRFEAKFRDSVKDILDSEQLELIPMKKILYRGPSIVRGEAGVTNDVMSFDPEKSEDIYEWGSDGLGVENPLANQQQNFFGKKSVLRGEPVTRKIVAVGGRHRESMVQRRQEKSDFLYPTKREQILKKWFQSPDVKSSSTKDLLSPSDTFDPDSLDDISYALTYEAPEDSFFSIAPVDEKLKINSIQPEDWSRMVEAQIDGAVEVRTDLPKFSLQFPTIPSSQPMDRPFLWPLTQIDYKSLHRSLVEQRNLFDKEQEGPPILFHDAPRSVQAIQEPSLFSSLLDPTYQQSRSRFQRKRGPKSRSLALSRSLRDTFGVSLVTEGIASRSSLRESEKRGVIKVADSRELWEPITTLSWMVVYKVLFLMWIQQVGKNFYQSYGKEILLYFINLLASLGFDAETLIEDLGLGEPPNYLRIIPRTMRRFRDLAGIDTTLPTLSEIVWFLRSSGRGKKMPKGFLLVGPPGTGKTFLVQAIAGEAEVPVVIQSATLLIDPEEKESPLERLKNVFDQARKIAPCILFIDEIDTLGASREGVMRNTMGGDRLIESIINPSQDVEKRWPQASIGANETFTEGEERVSLLAREAKPLVKRERADWSAHQEQETVGENKVPPSDQTTGLVDKQRLSLLMQLLVEMDGLQALQGLVVIGATNRPGVLDPALLRPGRFEKVLQLQLPGAEKRIEILQLYGRKIGVAQNVSWRYLASRTVGFSAADLSAVMNQSSIQAILQSTIHTIETIEAGIETIGRQTTEKGLPAGKGFLDPFLPIRLAYYQAGKAVVRRTLLPRAANLGSRSRSERSDSYLALWPQPGIDSSCQTLDRLSLEAQLIGLYAGKAGELFALSNDLCRNRRRLLTVRNQAVWDSDLGTKEIQLATEVANSMVNNWYLHSNAIPLKEKNRFLPTQNNEEIEEPWDREFCKRVAEENEMEGKKGGERRPGYQSHSLTAWWQREVTEELELVQPLYSNWYRLYLPDPIESDRNDEWVPPDENYHATPAHQTISTNETKTSLSWNDFQLLNRDYLLHGLLTTCFNEAFAIIEKRRELVDYFADHLIRFHLLRRDTIESIDSNFLVEDRVERREEMKGGRR